MHRKPIISVIVPMYNVAQYISESLDSVVQQNIGFKESVELIIVDDGSTDDSLAVAQKYAEHYPDNVIVKHQKNSGVSSARNLGLSVATGKYVHFFDGDDLLSKDYYRESIKFLEANDVDFVASKIKFFDKIINSHPLNDKFKRTRVIDLASEPQSPIAHIVTCVFKRESLHDAKFDTRLSIAEDMKLISDILLKKQAYGVLKKPTYFYRKRSDDSSAIASGRRSEKYYLPVVEHAYKAMINNWRAVGVTTLPMEYTFLYDLSHRLQQESQDALSDDQALRYKTELLELAHCCSTEAITGSKFLTAPQKIYLLKGKCGKYFNKNLTYVDGEVLIDGYKAADLRCGVFLDFLTHTGKDSYRVEGYIEHFLGLDGVNYFIDISGVRTELTFVPRKQREKSFLGEVCQSGGAFQVDVDMPKDAEVLFVVQAKDWHCTLRINTDRFTRLGALKRTYRRDGDRLFKKGLSKLTSSRYSVSRHLYLESRMAFQIVCNWRFDTVRDRLKKLSTYNLQQLGLKNKLKEFAKPWFFTLEAVGKIPESLLLRVGYYLLRGLYKQPIWLVSDRPNMAGDNGEALYRYMLTQNDIPAKVYFVIAKNVADYKNLKSVGPVLRLGSLRHKLMFLLADAVISSHADADTTNPFVRQIDRYADLMNFDFIFLQHGITKDDLSGWLNRFDKNIRLFIVSSKKEYDMILSDPYYYDKANILMSGMPRYDLLSSEPKGKLILAPTYRKYLITGYPDKNGNFKYNPHFKESEYRIFYNTFMNDQRIIDQLVEYNMTGEFYIHPIFAAQISDFNENEVFKLARLPYDYKKAFREGSMLVTDHSSVVFDFAYLKKPVVYAHFDMDSFFAGHSYAKSDAFSDEKDGFGEVCDDYESLVQSVIDSIKSGCVMPSTYQKRVDSFFAFVDQNNCKRVYDAIIQREK